MLLLRHFVEQLVSVLLLLPLGSHCSSTGGVRTDALLTA
jgi:hypothetical protein